MGLPETTPVKELILDIDVVDSNLIFMIHLPSQEHDQWLESENQA